MPTQVTTGYVVKKFGYTHQNVRWWIKTGKLKATKVGSWWIFNKADVDAFKPPRDR